MILKSPVVHDQVFWFAPVVEIFFCPADRIIAIIIGGETDTRTNV
ncbi:MAG: hypothetical protein ACM3O9_04155 [Methylocystaceae bacterium]